MNDEHETPNERSRPVAAAAAAAEERIEWKHERMEKTRNDALFK